MMGEGDGRRRWSARDVVLGIVGGGMILAAFLLLLFGWSSEDGGSPGLEVPELRLLTPENGAVVGSPVELRFESGVPLSPRPGGWGTEDLHLHVEIDGRESMPGPDDIRRVGGGTYVWTVPGVAAGERRLRLFWSDAAHRRIAEGATPVTRVQVR